MPNEITLFSNITIKVETKQGAHDPLLFRAYAFHSDTEEYIDSYVALSKAMAIEGLFISLKEIALEVQNV